MYVKPAARKVEGRPLVVRDPDLLDLLPAEGREVPESLYWHRRIAEGDVVLAQPPVIVAVDVQADGYAVQGVGGELKLVTLAEAAAEEVDRLQT